MIPTGHSSHSCLGVLVGDSSTLGAVFWWSVGIVRYENKNKQTSRQSRDGCP
jgi:hypothetical protein